MNDELATENDTRIGITENMWNIICQFRRSINQKETSKK